MSYAFAVTRPVNPAGSTPILTEEQLWRELEKKAREPSIFVPIISSCKLCRTQSYLRRREQGLSVCPSRCPYSQAVGLNTSTQLVREVTFGNSPKVITEQIEAHASTIVYFEMDTGNRVTNVVSYGPDDEMMLTYGFANGIPGVPADKPKPTAKELNAIVGKAVESNLAVVRQMVQDGKI